MENSLLLYFLKTNLALMVLYILFIIFFQRTTFHLINRVVLLFILIFPLLAPFLGYSFFSINDNAYIINEWFEQVDDFPIEWQRAEPMVSSVNTLSGFFFCLFDLSSGFRHNVVDSLCNSTKKYFRFKKKSYPM